MGKREIRITSGNVRDIVLPEGMTHEVAFQFLRRQVEEGDSNIRVVEEVDAFPLEGAYALNKAIQQMFGWSQAVSTYSFFGEHPPQMRSIEVGPGKYEEVIWGNLVIPGINGQLQTGAVMKGSRPVFVLGGKVLQRHKQQISELADLTRKIVREESIYKGKAIRLFTHEDGNLNLDEAPTFLDVEKVNPEELIFSRAIQDQIETNLFTPIRFTKHCRQYGVPLKRGVLLSGPYGTGKTLTAYTTAKACAENGWTFIYLDRVEGLREALLFAKQYAPAVVFAEDIDQVTKGDRGLGMNDVLNTIDGIDLKGSEIITILTTNFAEHIDKAMIRPGRLDAVIPVLPPDQEAVTRLLQLYARGLLHPGTDLVKVSQRLAGKIPAVVREVVERAKLYGLRRLDGKIEKEGLTITAEDLLLATDGMESHFELMENIVPPATTFESTLKDFMRSEIKGALVDYLEDSKETIDEIYNNVS